MKVEKQGWGAYRDRVIRSKDRRNRRDRRYRAGSEKQSRSTLRQLRQSLSSPRQSGMGLGYPPRKSTPISAHPRENRAWTGPVWDGRGGGRESRWRCC